MYKKNKQMWKATNKHKNKTTIFTPKNYPNIYVTAKNVLTKTQMELVNTYVRQWIQVTIF